MVIHFGEVEMTLTIEKVLASYESVGMFNKRNKMPICDLLIPKSRDFNKIKEIF